MRGAQRLRRRRAGQLLRQADGPSPGAPPRVLRLARHVPPLAAPHLAAPHLAWPPLALRPLGERLPCVLPRPAHFPDEQPFAAPPPAVRPQLAQRPDVRPLGVRPPGVQPLAVRPRLAQLPAVRPRPAQLPDEPPLAAPPPSAAPAVAPAVRRVRVWPVRGPARAPACRSAWALRRSQFAAPVSQPRASRRLALPRSRALAAMERRARPRQPRRSAPRQSGPAPGWAVAPSRPAQRGQIESSPRARRLQPLAPGLARPRRPA